MRSVLYWGPLILGNYHVPRSGMDSLSGVEFRNRLQQEP